MPRNDSLASLEVQNIMNQKPSVVSQPPAMQTHQSQLDVSVGFCLQFMDCIVTNPGQLF